MLYPEEHSADLKKWIVKRLENTSDADADVLADYVLALLKHDGDDQAVRTLFETEIPDFLKEDSTVFVNDVFEAIAYKSYLPGAPQPRPRQEAPVPQADPYGLSYDDPPTFQGSQAPTTLNGSRKRPYNDRTGAGVQNGRDGRFDTRSYKQPRRGGLGFGGRGDRAEDANNFTGSLPNPFANLPGQLPPPYPPPPSGAAPVFDQAALEALFRMPPLGFPGSPAPNFAPLSQGQPSRQSGRRRQRCRDYDTKGYCSRGNTCMFEHGDDSIYVPAMPAAFSSPQQPAGQPVEEYDPSNALITAMYPPAPSHIQQPMFPEGGRPPYGRGGRQQGRHQKHRPKAPFSADGPVLDRTKSTIVVENIPEENFTEDQVREFFSQFGSVLEVSMKPYKRLAVVKFDNWNSANAAYKSPKVVFENRFVKIFWYKDEETPALNGKGTNGFKKAGSAAGHSETGTGSPPPPEFDIEEFHRKQEEVQKAHEEKMQKLQEIEKQREELEKRQQALMAKQREEKARLEAKLAQKYNGSGSGSGSKGGDVDEAAGSTKPVSQTEALRAQLAALEAEAKQLGIDPDSVDDPLSPVSSRGGGYMGRGGYPPRARGYAPRGFRGGFRGGRGNNHAAYAAYSLDNRPKKVILSGVDFTIPEKDETLRQYLFGVGEFTNIQTSPASTDVTFKDRKTAEKFFNDIALNNMVIPGIDGQVELAWGSGGGGSAASSAAGTPSSTVGVNAVSSSSRNNAAKNGVGRATTHLGGDDGGSDDKDVNIILDSHHHHHEDVTQEVQQNDSMMDYDVADENQWDDE